MRHPLSSVAGRMAAFLVAAATLFAPSAARAQEAPAMRREHRGVWVATVSNLDWPSRGSGAADQTATLIRLLDLIKAEGFNTVYFQVRTEGDAFYRSATEPWSQFLTGVQGRDPGFDPLALAVAEAHKRGLELHAWLNPYRADASVSSTDDLAATHVLKRHPEWALNLPTLPNKRVLDPGIPAVRNYVVGIVDEIVRGYDVDGVHFDDYFYPYPEGSFTGMRSEDNATWQAYTPAGMSISVFRQYSVNILVRDVQARINSIRPSVRFGISPFGIWKSGTPSGVSGMSGADAIFADGVVWMEQGWLDYLTPQLYWKFGGGQDYAKLAPWWKTKMTPTVSTVPMPTTPRHLYPGLITSTNEVGRQIDSNRVAYGLGGHTIFRALTLLPERARLIGSRQVTPSIPLVMPWKGDTSPPTAPFSVIQTGAPGSVTVTWAAGAAAADGDRARWYAVQRIPAGGTLDVTTGAQIVAVVGASETSFVYTGTAAPGDRFVVFAYDDNWNESAASNTSFPVAADGALSAAATAAAVSASPSPARGAVTIRYRLPAGEGDGRVEVYDTLGRRVASLAAEAGGERQTVWEADVAPGVYVVRASTGTSSASARLVVVR